MAAQTPSRVPARRGGGQGAAPGRGVAPSSYKHGISCVFILCQTRCCNLYKSVLLVQLPL